MLNKRLMPILFIIYMYTYHSHSGVCEVMQLKWGYMHVCVYPSPITLNSRAVAEGRTSNTMEDNAKRIIRTGRNDNSIKRSPSPQELEKASV